MKYDERVSLTLELKTTSYFVMPREDEARRKILAERKARIASHALTLLVGDGNNGEEKIDPPPYARLIKHLESFITKEAGRWQYIKGSPLSYNLHYNGAVNKVFFEVALMVGYP